MIEINVKGSNIEVKDRLYCNKQGAFMRRDGSIQALKPNEIQDWIHRVRNLNLFRHFYQKYLSKLYRNDHVIENLARSLQKLNDSKF